MVISTPAPGLQHRLQLPGVPAGVVPMKEGVSPRPLAGFLAGNVPFLKESFLKSCGVVFLGWTSTVTWVPGRNGDKRARKGNTISARM